jgi:hypothetical protein
MQGSPAVMEKVGRHGFVHFLFAEILLRNVACFPKGTQLNWSGSTLKRMSYLDKYFMTKLFVMLDLTRLLGVIDGKFRVNK